MRPKAQTTPARLQPTGAVVASLQIVCAWCQRPLGWHQGQASSPFPISYSISACCYAEVARELAPMPGRFAHPLSLEA